MPDVAHAAAATLLADLNDHPELDIVAANTLVRAQLVSAPVADERLERQLTAIRADLLFAPAGRHLALKISIALQCYINECAWSFSAAEAVEVDRLRAAVQGAEQPSAGDLAGLAMFQPLSSIPSAERLLRYQWVDRMHGLLRQQLIEPRQEAALASEIEQLTPIADPTSVAIKRQYEQNPYPRWVVCDQIEPTNLELPDSLAVPEGANVLVAGCGTGQHSITTARRFANASVTAVDLSRSSLAYAVRKSRELRVPIRYLQADILALGQWPERFDVVGASGVLHHLRDPLAGWRVLVDLLKPAGLIRLGLYSRQGRQHVAAARGIVQRSGLRPDADGIRASRTLLKQLPADDPARSVVISFDFYSVSSCRDLLFHVQEQAFDLPMIQRYLRDLNLRFLGFDLPDNVLPRFRARHGHADLDLDAWHAFKADHPTTFTGMYQFWAAKDDAGGCRQRPAKRGGRLAANASRPSVKSEVP